MVRERIHDLTSRTLQAIDTIKIPLPESAAVLSSIADSIKNRCQVLQKTTRKGPNTPVGA